MFFFSFIFFHFLSFSFIFWVLKICFFLCLNFVTISLDNSYVKNQFLGPSRVVKKWYPFGPSFPFFFFLLFFFYCFSSCFSFLLIFCSFLHFFDFLMFFIFLVHFFRRKKFLLFFFLVFLSKIFKLLALVSEFNCFSIVGAPWRCGVLTTWGGIAGIGLGRLLG